MKLFLTSSPCIPGQCAFNPVNGFIDSLRDALPRPVKGIFIASDPSAHDNMVRFGSDMLHCFSEIGIIFSDWQVLDDLNAALAPRLVHDADLLVLAGGHVPTQMAFFERIGLRELLKNYDGTIMGISAGSMNSAEVVYAQPEEPGEGIDPDYKKFIPGLGLTDAMILPHYQNVKDDILDGMRLFEDITYADSMGHIFYVFPDGSYLYGDETGQELRGKTWTICDGVLRLLQEDGRVYRLFDYH